MAGLVPAIHAVELQPARKHFTSRAQGRIEPTLRVSAWMAGTGHDGDDAAIQEKYTVERTIVIQQDLFALTADMFKLRQKLLEIASWQSKQKAIARPI